MPTLTAARTPLVLALLLHATLPAHAARTRVQSVSGYEALAEGTPTGASVEGDGTIRPGPTASELVKLDNAGPVLGLACDKTGTCYVATSSPARVYVVDPAGKARVLTEPTQPLVTALALDAKDGLFVATAPEGPVLRVDVKSGKSETWWTPPAKATWGLAHDGTALWAVTGEPGALFKVTGKDKAQRVGEKALTDKVYRAVAVMKGGGVVVGGGRKGVIATVDAKGAVFAQHDSTLDEVTSLVVRPDGVIAAALVSNEGKAKGDEELLKVSEGGDDDEDTEKSDTKASEVVVVLPTGEARRVWRAKKDAAYALAWDARGQLLIGTGPRGRVYRADLEARRLALVARVEQARVTAMGTGARGLVLGTSQASSVMVLENSAKEATYLSRVMDSERHVRLGRVHARADAGTGCKLTLAVRSGNTDEPDETWSAFAPAVDWRGGAAGAPPARFAQVKAVMSGDGKCVPVLRELHVATRALNMAPVVAGIDVLAPGVRVEPMPNDEPKGRTFTVSGKAFEDFELKPLASPAPSEPPARAKQTYEAGWRTFAWQASDEDEDELRYKLELVTDTGTTSAVLASGLKDPFYSVDEARLPDGTYRVRVTADDGASNPVPEVLRAERLSDAFMVDRTPPLVAGKQDAAGTLALVVTDASPVIHVACSLDGAEPVLARPADGMLDGPREEATLPLGRLAKGHHHVACRAEDSMGNTGRLVLEWDAP